MKIVKVDYTVKTVLKEGKEPRFDLTVILKDIRPNLDLIGGKNCLNIEVNPSVPLSAEDYQLICDELEMTDILKETKSKGFRKNDCDAEVGIGTIVETGDKCYFVRVQLSASVYRTCYLSQSQICYLKYANLGYEFE